MKCYRFVTKELKSQNGDVQWKVGEWQKLGNNLPLKLCENGLHASKKPLDSLNNVYGRRWFWAEAKGEKLEDNGKFCCREIRLIREISKSLIVQFAVDCAKHLLPIFEKQVANDKR